MLSSATRFQMNDTEVTATVIDGEAIMINLSSGVYYSTDAVGARIWELATESGLALAAYLMLEYLEEQQHSLIPPFVFQQLRQGIAKTSELQNEQLLICARNQNAVTYNELLAAAASWHERAWLWRWMLLPPLTTTQRQELKVWHLPVFYLKRRLRYLKRQFISTKPSKGHA